MKDLIQQATAFAESGASFTGAEVRLWVGKLTDALERLTAGDVALPEAVAKLHPNHLAADQDRPIWCREVLLYSPDNEDDKYNGVNTRVRIHTNAQLIDYGNRKDAAGYLRGVLAERDHLADLLLDDAYAMTFQSMGQYRTALISAIRKGTP